MSIIIRVFLIIQIKNPGLKYGVRQIIQALLNEAAFEINYMVFAFFKLKSCQGLRRNRQGFPISNPNPDSSAPCQKALGYIFY
jgi:hypothetical protein